MEKIKLFFVRVWAFLKRIWFYIKLAYIRLAALVVKARRGEALEVHPAVGRWARIIFKVFLGLAIFIFAIEVAFGIGIYKYHEDDDVTRFVSKIIPFPAAVVQGRIVTVNDFFRNYQYIEKFYKSTGESDVDMEAVKSQILSQLIDTELLKSQARKFSVEVKNSDVENAYSEVVVQNGGEEEVKKVLADLYGLSIKEFKKLIADQLLEQKMIEAVPVQIHARHILIRVDQGASQDKVDEAKARTDKVVAEVRGGLDFAEAAKKYSEDTGSATNGGDLDFFARGQLDTDFENAAFALPIGQVSDPVKTQYGWHIIKVEEKKGVVDKSFSDWLKEIKDQSLIVQLLNAKK